MAEPKFTVADLRKERGETQEQFAVAIGLSANSKGHVSAIERGAACSVQVALTIERLSGGRIPAESLQADIALVRAAADPAPGGAGPPFNSGSLSQLPGDGEPKAAAA